MDMEKHDNICQMYWNIRERVQDDPEYARMRAALEALTPAYEAALNTLPQETQLLFERYILLRESMNSRILEYACEQLLRP